MANNVKAGGAYIELFTKDSGLIKGLNAASKKLSDFGGGLVSAGARVVAFGGIVGGAMVAAAVRFADAGSAIDDAAQRTGTSAEAFSGLAYAAKMAGSDAETLEKSLIKLNQNVADAASGNKTAQATFAKLGLSIADLQGLSPDEQMKLIADRLAAIPDHATRTAMAMDIFGKSGAQLLPMLAQGSAGIEAMQAEAEALGLVMSSEDAAAAATLGDALDKLTMTVGKVVQAVGAALAPTLTEAIDIFTGVAVGIKKVIDANRPLVVGIAAGVAAITAFGAAMVAAGGVSIALGAILGGVATVLTAVGATIAFLLSPIGLVIAGITTLGAVVWANSDASGKAINWFGEQFDTLVGDTTSAMGAIGDALASGDIAAGADILWNYLATLWDSGKVLLYDITNELTSSLIDLWFSWSASLQTTAISAMGAVSDAFTTVGDYIQSFWTHIFAWFEDKYYIISGFIQKLLSGFDEAQSRQIDAQTAENRKVASAANSALAASSSDLATAQADRQRQIQDINASSAQARQDFGNPLALDTNSARQQLATDRQALQRSINAVPARDAVAGPEKPQLQPIDMEAIKQASKASVAGTFSAQAVGGIGGPAERTANNTEQMKKTLIRMEQNGMGAFA